MTVMPLPDMSPDPVAVSHPFEGDLTGKTILQVVPRLEIGGAERTTVDMARAITEAGGRAIVVAAPGRLVPELKASGAFYVPMAADRKSPLAMLSLSRKLARLVRQEQIDLVHARSRAPAWPALWAARKTKRPFLTTYHGIYSQTNALKGFYNSVMARGDLVIANSAYTADLIAKRHPFAQTRLRIVYRGTDLDQFVTAHKDQAAAQALRQDWQIPDDGRPLALNMARLTSWKGQSVLIEAIAQLKARYVTKTAPQPFPRFILAGGFAGNETYRDALLDQIRAQTLEQDVQLVGQCDDVAAAHALSDLAIVASTREEAFGRAAVEAGLAGLVIIATDHGAAPETVLAPPKVPASERTGWLVRPGDPLALATALEHVLGLSDRQRGVIGQRARDHCSRHFSLSAMQAQTLDIYRSLLSRSENARNA